VRYHVLLAYIAGLRSASVAPAVCLTVRRGLYVGQCHCLTHFYLPRSLQQVMADMYVYVHKLLSLSFFFFFFFEPIRLWNETAPLEGLGFRTAALV